MTTPGVVVFRVVMPLIAAAGLSAAPTAGRRPAAGTVETPCDTPGTHVARQGLGGDVTGAASVDVSGDGRVIAFVSMRRLTPADANAVDDIYTLDRTTGAIALESAAPTGAANGSSQQPRISADGRVVVFASMASNVIGVAGGPIASQVMRRDRVTGATTLVSHSPAGAPGNGWSGQADVSGNGRYVVFESQATDLVPGPDANHGGSDVYLYDASDGAVRRVSLTDAGIQSASGQSGSPAIDAAGRVIAFASTAPLDGPARARPEQPIRSVFRRDLSTGETRRLSAARGGSIPDGASFSPTISGDGGRTVFVSVATNLAGGSAGARRRPQLYLHDAGTGQVRRISRGASGAAADGFSRHPSLSGNGRFVVFSSDASDLPCADRCGPFADRNLVSDVYRLEVATGAVDRVSGGPGAREPWWTPSAGAAVDRSGRVVVFSSRQPVDEADLEDDDDLFVAVLPAAADQAQTGWVSGPAPMPCGAVPNRPGIGRP